MEKVENYQLAQLKPFRLVKFFSFTSLAVILLSALALTWVISNYATNILLERSKSYTLVLAENLGDQVFQQFVFPLSIQGREIALQDPRQFQKLDSIVKSATQGTKTHSVTIFSKKDNVVSYSTNRDIVGKAGLGGEEYEQALQGETSSILWRRGSMLNLVPGNDEVSCRLSTTIPLMKGEPFARVPVVIGVIEIVRDLSDDMEDILTLQAMIALTSIVVMGFLFLILRLIVSRADRIMEARAAERRLLEDKLNQAKRLASLGKMVSSVSHEIKNPLGIIGSTAEILGRRMEEVAPENSKLTKIIVDETTRLDTIVREFLDFARPRQSRMEEVSLNQVLTKVGTFVEEGFAGRGISLKFDLTDPLPVVQADFDQLYQVWLNILINCDQAMEDGGEVTIASTTDGDDVVVTVADTGCGMSSEVREQIFTPFFTSKNRGTGLGLAIVRKIINNHGGEIDVDSREGEGTVFTITLPRAGGG